jgi:geranylgeranyl reductase family protein
MVDCDVAVVGAGPAGTSCARLLAAAGVRTLLLERARRPRYKSCAGGIPLRTARLLPFAIDSVVEDTIERIDVTHRGRRGFIRTSREPIAHMVMRDRFDELLAEQAEAAGARILDRTAVRGVERDGGRFLLRTNREPLRASLVVGADGASGVVGRATGLGTELSSAVALEAEVRASGPDLARWRSTVNVDVGYLPAGYGWVFPKASLLSVGVVQPRALAARLRSELYQYLDRLGLRGATLERLVGHQVLFRRDREPIAGHGVLLAGDAAGLVDEFTEEGIYYAIRSGEIAARFLARALAGRHTWLGAYQHAVDRELMPELRAARTIARLYYGAIAHVPRAMHLISARAGYLWTAFFQVQRGESSYEEQLRRARIVAPLSRLLLR